MSPQRYTKRPVTIEAVQFEGSPQAATPIIDWILSSGGTARWHEDEHLPARHDQPVRTVVEHIAIDTLEGTMRAEAGDWIIRGIQGEFYPCKPDVFAQTYVPEGVAG